MGEDNKPEAFDAIRDTGVELLAPFVYPCEESHALRDS